MSWLQRIAQRYEDTKYWGRSFRQQNPDFAGGFEVYQSPHFPHVFLGGEQELDEAEEKAGQPMCKIVDCRDLPEIDAENPSWDYGFYATVKAKFDKKVKQLAGTIQSADCPIYVHCAMGANRSVSVLAAAISLLTNQPIDTILSDMKQSRMVVNPQDPYYLMALEESPAESPEFKERRYLELDQDFPLVQPGLPEEESFLNRAETRNWLQRMAQQKTLIVSRGPSGSGKSSMSRKLSEQLNAPVFTTDDFFMQSGSYQFDPSQLGQAHEWNRQRVEESMRGETPLIIVDNTNTQFWEMKPYVQLAQQYGYAVDFKEPEWHSDLKTPEGVWNVDFLESMQDQPDREKSLPRHILEQMVSRYEYNPSVEAVLQSERPERPARKRIDDELEERA